MIKKVVLILFSYFITSIAFADKGNEESCKEIDNEIHCPEGTAIPIISSEPKVIPEPKPKCGHSNACGGNYDESPENISKPNLTIIERMREQIVPTNQINKYEIKNIPSTFKQQ